MTHARLVRSAVLTAGLAVASVALAQPFTLTSSDIVVEGTPGQPVINGFGCSGKNVSPALSWSGAPKSTKSFALLVHDPDAPTGGAGWWHWLVVNIPASTTELKKDAGKADSATLPQGAEQITTDLAALAGVARALRRASLTATTSRCTR